jgi:hypothetical protein
MTVGKDVSGLFPDVLKNMVSLVYGELNRERRELMVDVALQQTEDLEQKKVSY